MIMPTPTPRGVVLYAGRNSRRREYAAYLTASGGSRVGYLRRLRPTPRPLPGWSRGEDLGWYEVATSDGRGLSHRVAMSSRPSRTGANPLRDAATGTAVGHARREEVVNGADVRQLRNDSGGMFRPVAQAFHHLYGTQVVPFQNVHDDFDEDGLTERDTRENFFDAVGTVAGSGLDFFAYAGHGSSNGLPSAGITTAGGTDRGFSELTDAIRRLCRLDGWVLLYACETATAGGFAERLSGVFPRMTVIGHRGAGPASRNPLKYRIVGGRSQAMRDRLPEDVRPLWTDTALLRDRLYARVPFLSADQIAAELRGEEPPRGVSPPRGQSPLLARPAQSTRTG